MRLKGRQARFVLAVVGGWVAARAAIVWSGNAPPGPGVSAGVALLAPPPPPWPRATPQPGFRAARAALPAAGGGVVPSLLVIPVQSAKSAPLLPRPAPDPPAPVAARTTLRRATFAAPAERAGEVRAPASARTTRSRWTGAIDVFIRPGSGRPSLAAGGQLGGSQAAARVTYQLNAQGPVRTAIAARLYAPLASRGAEAAAGLDWHPLPGVPLRLSVERRVALDRAGRNAWSAYAAGGFYAERFDRTVAVDGYAQAGVVGARSRDLFVDGALRAGRRWTVGPGALTLGAGLWGAAQPGVARLDAGPRLAIILPVARHLLSAAIEGRLRVAGRAKPGPGAALTIGLDL